MYHLLSFPMFFLTILILSSKVKSKEIVKHCYNKHSDEPVSKEKNIDALLRQTMILECRICKEELNRFIKYWYEQTVGANNTFSNETVVTQNYPGNVYLDHLYRLVIKEFTVKDIGVYYCRNLVDDHIKDGYVYFVDIVDTSNLNDFIGNVSVFNDYYLKYIQATNEKLVERYSNLTVFMEWSMWGSCSPYDSFHKRIQSRVGKCRVNVNMLNVKIDTHLQSLTLSCRSQLLFRTYPELKTNLSSIPHYQDVRNCKSWFTFEEDQNFECEDRDVTLLFGSDLTMLCPHSDVISNVTWSKDGKQLDVIKEEVDRKNLHAFVDVFSILYLSEVREKDSGLYSCKIDDKKSLNLKVTVTSKPRMLFGAFLRHSLYLFFIAYMFIPVYCIGLKFYLRRCLIPSD